MISIFIENLSQIRWTEPWINFEPKKKYLEIWMHKPIHWLGPGGNGWLEIGHIVLKWVMQIVISKTFKPKIAFFRKNPDMGAKFSVFNTKT